MLAHLQHVLMYSTTRIPDPVAHRTRQVQDDVQDAMRRLHRPVTFADLAREWTGTDASGYGVEMKKVAEKYTAQFCRAPAQRGSRVPPLTFTPELSKRHYLLAMARVRGRKLPKPALTGNLAMRCAGIAR